MAKVLVNRAKMTTNTTGTGTITLGSTVSGFQSFSDAGVTNGDVVRYVIEDGDYWELGLGTYTASGTTLARNVVESSNSNQALNLSGSAFIFVTAGASDYVQADGDVMTGDLTVTNIITSGNVDGRDVSVDGAKLDGIEAGATADQTKSDIDGLNINADTLDGQHGAYYTGYVDTAIANLADSAPATLDTLNELASALGDDANFSTTITNSIATKLALAGGTMTGDLNVPNIITSGNVDGRDLSVDGSKLDGIETGATADQTASQIKTAYESNNDTNEFSDAEQTKLANIESNATADQTSSEIRSLVNSANDSNVFTDADHSKLNAIEASATADQTGAEIKALYEAEVNAFTDTLKSKLDGIETNATADQTGAQIKALYQAEVNAFTDTLKSKLDSIEPSATADQTASEIRTLVESATDSNVFTDADHTKLNSIEASADITDTTNVVASLTAGTNIAIASNGTISSTDTNTTYSIQDGELSQNNFTNADHSKLDGIEASADVTDTANVVGALTAGNNVSIASNGTISSTDTNTTYSVQDGELSENNFTDADHSKLNAIEAGATADQTDAEIKTAYENNSNTNAFTDADHTKLNGIEASATADQTATEIRALVESASDSNVFTDADHSKLNGIEASAKDDQTITAGSGLSGGGTGNVTLSHSDTSSQASVNGSGRTYIQDITLDTYGHVTALATATETVTDTTYSIQDGELSQNNFTNADHSKLNAIEANADVTDTTNVVSALTAGSNISIASNGTISSTDTNTTYSIQDGELSQNNFTDADHTKLNGIETNATADQTKSDIEGLGIDVPATNLTGTIPAARLSTATTQSESDDSSKIATTAYVTDKITTLIGGAPSTLNDLNELAAAINDDANYNTTLTTALATKLPLAGGTMTGDVLYGDGVKAKFGADPDLQIYHSGSHSHIHDTGSGNLYLDTNGAMIEITYNANNENMAQFAANGAVTLYYDNAAKLATTSTGASVTGSLAVSDASTTRTNLDVDQAGTALAFAIALG